MLRNVIRKKIMLLLVNSGISTFQFSNAENTWASVIFLVIDIDVLDNNGHFFFFPKDEFFSLLMYS